MNRGRMAGLLGAMVAIMASAPRGVPSQKPLKSKRRRRKGSASANVPSSSPTQHLVRRMANRVEVARRWAAMFRVIPRNADGGKIRVLGQPVKTKKADKRAFLSAAQAINPAIRTMNGARKLDQRLTREAKAGAA